MKEDESEKVSVIVPIYNVALFLEKLIVSVLNQTYRNMEIILVDDGSSDDSGKICDKYAKKDSRIKVMHKKNEGVSEARNNGLKTATGNYITFVDGDDWLEPDYVDYMLMLVHETHTEMCMSLRNFTTRDRKQTEKDSIKTITSEEAVAMMLYPYLSIGCWNKIYSREFLTRNNLTFTHHLSGEGMVFIVSAAQRTDKVGVGSRKVYNYRLNNRNSATTKYNLDIGLYAFAAIRKIKNELIIRTPKTINACNWHILKNYHFILFLIIATDSRKENEVLYKDCLYNIRKLLLPVLVHSEVTIKTKVSDCIHGIIPVLCAKRSLRKNKKALEKDNFGADV